MEMLDAGRVDAAGPVAGGMAEAERAARQPQLAYFLYENGIYPAADLRAAIDALQARRFRVIGLIQHESRRPDRSHCDMELEDIVSGTRIPISEERGAAARGCRLDPAGLAAAYMAARAGLANDPDLVVISKFGKIEAEGGGLRDLIAEALEAGVPVLIGVPERNLAGWCDFAGDLALQVGLGGADLRDWLDGGAAATDA